MANKPATSYRIHDYPLLPITPPPLDGDIDIYSQNGILYARTTRALRQIAYEPVDRSRILVNQRNHNFQVCDVVRSDYTSNSFTKAQADTADNSEMVGLVDEIVDKDNFYLLQTGELLSDRVPDQPAGTVMFLSVATPGLMTATVPSSTGEISKPVAEIIEPRRRLLVLHYRGVRVIEDPGLLGFSGYSGYSGRDGIGIPFDIDGGYANSDYWIFDVDGGYKGAIYGAIESIDGGFGV